MGIPCSSPNLRMADVLGSSLARPPLGPPTQMRPVRSDSTVRARYPLVEPPAPHVWTRPLEGSTMLTFWEVPNQSRPCGSLAIPHRTSAVSPSGFVQFSHSPSPTQRSTPVPRI